MDPIRTKSYGPFEIIGELTGDGRVMLALPFQDVVGCKVLVGVTDNFNFSATDQPLFLWPGAEISVWCVVQGYETMIKRQCVHMQSGPMSMTFDYAEGWDTINFRGRNACGGSFQNNGLGAPPTQASGASLTTNIYIKPRTGFGTPSKQVGAISAAKAG